MTDSLKERLKKCGRSYKSPIISSSGSQASSSSLDKTPKSLPKSFARRTFLTFKSPASVPSQKENTVLENSNIVPCDVKPQSPQLYDAPKRILTDDFNAAVDDHQCEGKDDLKGTKRKRADTIDNSIQDNQHSHDNQCNKETSNLTLNKLLERRQKLQTMVADKEETLRKLKMVKLYRAKNELSHLDVLISRWRDVSCEAIVRLHGLAQHPQPTITELIDYLHIEHHMIGFNPDDESFSSC